MKGKACQAVVPVLFTVLCMYSAFATTSAAADRKESGIKVSKEGQACISCHEPQSPSFVKDWRGSRHAMKGVDCYSCHRAGTSERTV